MTVRRPPHCRAPRAGGRDRHTRRLHATVEHVLVAAARVQRSLARCLTARALSCGVPTALAVAASCTDNLKNHDEDGVDCGGAGCPWPCGEHSPSFHHFCDGPTPTLTVVRTTDGYVFAGVSPTGWGAGLGSYGPQRPVPKAKGYPSQANQEFLVCINCAGNPNKVFPLNLTGTNNEEATIVDHMRGPVFGGRDLSIANQPSEDDATSSSALGHSYTCPVGSYRLEACQNFLAGSVKFRVQNYETFSLHVPSLLSEQHRAIVGAWIAIAEKKEAGSVVTGTLATRCFSFAEAEAIAGMKTFSSACSQETKTVVVVLTDKGFLFGGYSGVAWTSQDGGRASPTAFLFCLNCAGKPGDTRELKHMGGVAEQEPGVVVRAPNSAPGFGLVPSQPDKPLDLDVHIAVKDNLAQGKSNLGEAFSCPASTEAGCPMYLAGEQYFNVVDYQAFKVEQR